MIRVNLVEISPDGGFNKTVEMAAVPRVGDNIAVQPGDASMEVRSVIWVAFKGTEYDVQVRFR